VEARIVTEKNAITHETGSSAVDTQAVYDYWRDVGLGHEAAAQIAEHFDAAIRKLEARDNRV